MNTEKQYMEALDTLKEFGEVLIWVDESEQYYNICGAENYSGGEEGYYMSDYMGNVQYDDPEELLSAIWNVIESDGERVVDITVD